MAETSSTHDNTWQRTGGVVLQEENTTTTPCSGGMGVRCEEGILRATNPNPPVDAQHLGSLYRYSYLPSGEVCGRCLADGETPQGCPYIIPHQFGPITVTQNMSSKKGCSDEKPGWAWRGREGGG